GQLVRPVLVLAEREWQASDLFPANIAAVEKKARRISAPSAWKSTASRCIPSVNLFAPVLRRFREWLGICVALAKLGTSIGAKPQQRRSRRISTRGFTASRQSKRPRL